MINRNEIKLTKEKKEERISAIKNYSFYESEEKLELGSNIIFAYLH